MNYNVLSRGNLCFNAPLRGLCIPVGISLLPLCACIQEGSKSQGPRGSNSLQTPCELPEGNLGLIGSALPQHPWQHWTPSKNMSHQWNQLSGEQKHERVQRWPLAWGRLTPPEFCFHEVTVFACLRNTELHRPSIIPASQPFSCCTALIS